MQIVLCVVVGSAVLFGVFVGFRKLSQIIIRRRFEKAVSERMKK